MDLARYLDRLTPASSEAVYERLVGYAFARRYAVGKTVADIGGEEVGDGSRLLAETAGSVVGMAVSEEALDVASTVYSAPNVSYRRVDLPDLPYPDEHFDLVVAFGLSEKLEQPEDLVEEAKRVLKRDGMLVVSTPDKRAQAGNRESGRPLRGMHFPEFRELLERYFGSVHMYRQGVAAGGFVFPEGEGTTDTAMESGWFSLTGPAFNAEPPTTRCIMAVCGSAEVLERVEQPYLLLDRDRRMFDEFEDQAEDIELLRAEIENMQKSEVQNFREALRLRGSELAYLRARVRRSEAEAQRLKTHIHNMQSSMTWRVFEPYRRLRTRIDAVRKHAPAGDGGSDDRHSS